MSLIRVAVLVVAAGVCGTTLVACCCGTPSTGSGSSSAVLPTKFAQELRPTQANQAQLTPASAQR